MESRFLYPPLSTDILRVHPPEESARKTRVRATPSLHILEGQAHHLPLIKKDGTPMTPSAWSKNPCKNIHGKVMLLLEKGSRDTRLNFDVDAVAELAAPLPAELREKIVAQFSSFARAYTNVRVHGKKMTNNSLNRLIWRLDNSLWEAEDLMRETNDYYCQSTPYR